jgi:hypothetical protein
MTYIHTYIHACMHACMHELTSHAHMTPLSKSRAHWAVWNSGVEVRWDAIESRMVARFLPTKKSDLHGHHGMLKCSTAVWVYAHYAHTQGTMHTHTTNTHNAHTHGTRTTEYWLTCECSNALLFANSLHTQSTHTHTHKGHIHACAVAAHMGLLKRTAVCT